MSYFLLKSSCTFKLLIFISSFFHGAYSEVNATFLTICEKDKFYYTNDFISKTFEFKPKSSTPPSSNTTNCYSKNILGGHNVLGKSPKYQQILQKLINIPPHYALHEKFTIYKFGDWKLNNVDIQAFSANMPSPKSYFTYAGYDVGGNDKVCSIGSSYIEILYFKISDNFDSDITITYNINNNNNVHFGIRDIYVTVLLCHPSCLKCTSPVQCTQCIKNANLLNNICQCNLGFYLIECNQTSINMCVNICQPCFPSCSVCTNGLSNGCTTCQPGYALSSGICTNDCLTNQFTNGSECYNCSNECGSCISSANTCTSCTNTNYFLNDNTCIENCPERTYPNSSTKTCDLCHSECFSCNGDLPSDCLLCTNYKYFYNESCTSTCPQNTYENSTHCLNCNASCDSCHGPNSTDCSSCNSSFFLYNGECLISCPEEHFYGSLNFCFKCDPMCLTCNGSEINNCNSCVFGSKRIVDNNNMCLCQDGTYENITNLECINCDESCLTCSDSGKSNCISCKEQRYFSQNSCLCFDGNFSDDASGECNTCDSTCLTCSDQRDFCLSCTSDRTYFNNSCFYCQNGTYFDEMTLTCKPCDFSCLTCEGPENYNCSLCKADRIFLNNLCECKNGTFSDETTKICELCDSSCLTCSGKHNNCSSCSFNAILSNNTCSCMKGNFFNQDNKLCQTCDALCSYCEGPIDCLACSNESQSLAFGKCMDSCPNYYFSDDLKMCRNCISNCKKCENSSQCKICSENYTLNNESQCIFQKKIYAQLDAIQNPTSFKLTFSHYWQYLMDNLEKLMIISINNYPLSNYSYQITNTDNTSILILTYKAVLNDTSLILNLTIEINYSETNSEFYLIDKNFLTPLKSYIVCPDNFYYNSENKTCQEKHLLKPKLKLMENHLQVSLDFSYSFISFENIVKFYSSIIIEGLTYQKNYNISIVQNNNQNDIYSININSSSAIINRPKLTYCINISQEVIIREKLTIPTNCDTIALLDWYILSESEQKTIENTVKQTAGNNFVSANGMSSLLASSSGIFLFGLMMIEMIYFLKYIKVNYPPNALSLFETKQNSYVLFFRYNFVCEEDLNILPEIYTFYGVSPYFLNNCGEILCQITAVICLSLLMFIISFFFNGRFWLISKIFGLIERIFVWELVILFILLSIQKLFFYITSALNFFPVTTQGILNSIIALSVALILILWIINLFIHAKKCQKFRLNHQQSLSPGVNKNNSFSTNLDNSVKDLSGLFSLRDDHNKFNEKNKNKIQASNIDDFENETNSTPTTGKNPFKSIELNRPTELINHIYNQIFPIPKTFKKNISTNEINKPIDLMQPNILKEKKRFFNKIINCCMQIFVVHNWIKYVSKYESLFQDVKYQTIWQKYYKLFYYIRQILISVLVPSLYNYPIPQMIIITLVYGSFLVYTIVKNPFSSRIIFIINVVSELICFSSIISVLVMVFLDYFENKDSKLKMNLGWVIIFANIGLLYWVMATGIIKMLYHLILKCKQRKMRRGITPQ